MGKLICGVDLGGTKINTGIVNDEGKIIKNIKVPTLAEEGPEAVTERINKSIYDVLDAADITISDISGIGIGSPGPLDAEKGIILKAVNLPGWDNFPLVDRIKRQFNLPVKLDNDANAAAYGEYLFGSGKGLRNFVYLTVSTGIGGGAIIDGKLYHGANSNAAEIGHSMINFNGPKCNCGNNGCFEAFASGTSLARFAREAVEKGRATLIKDIAGDGPVKAEYVFEAAQKGDLLAKELIDNEAFYLGIGVANTLAFFNPEKIAIGGGISNQWDMFYDRMIETVRRRSLKALADVCEIVKAELSGDIGVYGAAAIMF